MNVEENNEQEIQLVIVSDLHVGSTLGLSPPSVPLDDGGIYLASKPQRWLWGNWVRDWNKIFQDVKVNGRQLWVVFNGDIIDGKHHNTTQIFSGNPKAQIQLANKIIEPIADKAKYLFFVRGTSVHVGESAWSEELIAENFSAEQNDNGVYSWWKLLLKCNEVVFDIAHHVGGGGLPWTFANAANKLAAEGMLEYAMNSEKPPNVVVRAHKHVYRQSADNYPTRAIIAPAWQLKTEYTYRIAVNSLPSIGMLSFVCTGGTYKFTPVIHKFRKRRIWTPKKSQKKK